MTLFRLPTAEEIERWLDWLYARRREAKTTKRRLTLRDVARRLRSMLFNSKPVGKRRKA